MKLHSAVFSTMAVVVIAIVATPTLYADADQAILLMRRAEPAVVKAGEPVTIYGQALDRSKVSDVMLATASKQIPVEVLEQTESFIRFRVPADLEPGRYNPAVLSPIVRDWLPMAPTIWLARGPFLLRAAEAPPSLLS